jgi:6-phosphogluconolactonase
MRVSVCETPDELARQAADWIVARIAGTPGRLALCLSGGHTPRRLYELLGAAPCRDGIPWARTHCFWGDERFVPHDDPRSNFRMAHESLLEHVPIPAENVHAIPTDRRSVSDAAAEYERTLQAFYGADGLDPGRPLFDLTLLGLGEDGHIASLFPNSPALNETQHWVVPVSGQGELDRITLAYPALASSAVTIFLVAGQSKRAALSRLRAGDLAVPAARLHSAGEVLLFADRAAISAPALSGA